MSVGGESAVVGIRRGLIPEDLLTYTWVEDVALDPSAEIVAYTLKRMDAQANDYITHVYIDDLRDDASQCLTSGPGQASSLAWSASGEELAFAWSEGDRHAVHVWSPATSSVRVIPLAGAPMFDLAWSPDGRYLAGVRWTRHRHAGDRSPRPGIPEPTIRVIRRLRYKQDGVGFVHDRYAQIWIIDLSTGDVSQITDSECDFFEPSWSQHGDRLAFIGVGREQDVPLGQGQIFVSEFPGGAPRLLLPDWPGACRSPVWGNDDRSIAFAGHSHPGPTNRRIFMTPHLADVATGTARPLVPDLDEEVGNYAIADSRPGLTNVTVKWPIGDRWIYFLLTELGATHLCRCDAEGELERVVEGPVVVFEYSPAAGDQVAFGVANPENPGDLYVWKSGRTQRIAALNSWLRDRRLALPTEYWYDGLDGAKVHSWIMRPPGMNEDQAYPTIVYVHCSMFSWDYSHEFQCLAGAGFVVAYFNQRGTTAGYGQAWTRASEGDQGGRDYEEIMLGVDDLVARSYVDASRLGVTGGSCGGFMTNWIIGHTDRFAAAVTQRSITNNLSFAGTSDYGPEWMAGELGESPWTELTSTWRQSPLAYASNMRTPLLILHSDQDHRCALEQAEQLFAALRWAGREVEFVIFEGESHGLYTSGRPGNRIERLRRILGWFESHLGTRPV